MNVKLTQDKLSAKEKMPSPGVKKTGTLMFEKDVVDGITFFTFKSYEDMVGLHSSENLHTSLVSIKEGAPGEVSSECIQSVPATVSKDSISETPPNGQLNLPLVNGVEPSTITMPASSMDPCTSSNEITMKPRIITPGMATAFSNTVDLCTSNSVSEHNGLNQHIENLDQCMNFTRAQFSHENAMCKLLLKKLVNATNERNEEINNISRLQQDYKKMENTNTILVRENISMNTKYFEAANEIKYLKNEINTMKITLNHNPKSNETELSRVVEILKKVSDELDISQKLQNLINEKTELENQLKEHLEKNETLKAKYLHYKATAKKLKKHILRLKRSQSEQKSPQKPTTVETIMIPIDEAGKFDNRGVSNMDVNIQNASNNMLQTHKSSKRKDSLLRKTVISEAKKCKLFIDHSSVDSKH